MKSTAVTRLALANMMTGFVMFLAMGLLGYAMRLDQAGFWVLNPALFYEIMSLHGVGMVTAALIAAIGGLIEVLNGSTEIDTRLGWAAYVVGADSFALIVVVILVGHVGAGWTMLYPLPYHSQHEWTIAAAALVYVGYLMTAIAFGLYCLMFLKGTIRAAGGLSRALAFRYLFTWGHAGRENLPTPSQLAATVVSLDGLFTVVIGFLWFVPQLLQAGGVIGPMNVLLVKNVLMEYGHMITNLAMYTALGILVALLPIITNRVLRTNVLIVLALDLVLFFLFTPYGHHLYADFAEPKAILIFSEFASSATTIPVTLVAIMGGLTMMYRSRMKWSVPSILVAIGLWGWVYGGLAGVMDSIIPINQVTHNTLWVPGHFHTYYLLACLAFTFAYMYHVIAERSGYHEKTMSRVAACLYGVGGAGFVTMFLVSGAMSVPRRYAQHIAAWQLPDQIAVGFVGVLAFALLWLGTEMIVHFPSAWRGQSPARREQKLTAQVSEA